MVEKYALIRGIYRDILKDKNNNIILNSGWNSNVIVNNCRTQLAAFMKNEPPKGIQRLKVGIGNPAWDIEGLPEPDSTVTDLEDKTDSLSIEGDNLNLFYLDENEVESDTPTHRLQITATLGDEKKKELEELGYPFSYPLREFGLFGEFPDGTEYMIDYITHPVIHKDITATLIRVVRLYF